MNQSTKPYTDTNMTSDSLRRSHPPSNSDGNDYETTKKSYWRWKAPLAIFLPLTVGLGFAIAHHSINAALNGQQVSNVSVSQSWISRFGTGIAFLVKVTLGVSVAASYVQYQWFQLRRQDFRLDEIDSLTGALENVLHLFYNFVFLRQPILLLMVIVAWTIPFAAVFTPGSLTVHPARSVSTIKSQVPQLDLNSTLGTESILSDTPLTADPQLYNLAFTTASTGQPVAILPRYQNSTYRLSFHGPAVKCTKASDVIIKQYTEMYGTPSYPRHPYMSAPVTNEFVSWVPGAEPEHDLSTSDFDSSLDDESKEAARIFVVTNSGAWEKSIPLRSPDLNKTLPITFVNVTECRLHNVSYEVDFSFHYPNQTTRVSISHWWNGIPNYWQLNPNYSGLNYRLTANDKATRKAKYGYLNMMQVFGKLLVGYSQSQWSLKYVSTPTYTSYQLMDIDWADSRAVESGLESLFQNLTVSLFSKDKFLKPESETQPVPITVTTYPLTYRYSARGLVLPYALAIGFALICAVAGACAFFINDASYQNIFSSFLRATSGHEIRALLDSNSSGADPLPRHEAQARIMIGAVNGKRE